MTHVAQSGSLYKLGSALKPVLGAGRLLLTGPHQWSYEDDSGWPGWSYNSATIAHHEAFTLAALDWLAGAHTGLDILIAGPDPATDHSYFGPDFQTYVSGLGNAITLTGNGETWGGKTLSDYSVIVMHGNWTDEVRGQTDDYLDARSGSVLGSVSPGAWDRYGIATAGFYTVDADRLSHFYCAPLGAAQYALYAYVNSEMVATTQTRPGTRTFYDNEWDEHVIALWENV